MPKKTYLPYPVTKDWGKAVKDALAGRKRGAQQRLLEFLEARGFEISSGHLSDILGGKYDTSEIVEPVHEFLGWSKPIPPIVSKDAGELAHIAERLTPEQRKFIEAGATQVAEMSGDEARRHLAEMLAALSPSSKSK